MDFLNLDLTQLASVFIVLFSIIDILGSIPIILGIKSRGEVVKPALVSIIAFIILITFLFLGEGLLKFFSVDIKSFAVAGAIIIFIFSTEMILDIEIFKNKGPKGSASIVPLAFPLVAGPASFTTLLTLRAEYAMINVVLAVLLNMIFVYLVLHFTDKIEKIIGEGGIYVFRKFFGIILLAISVKIFTSNIGSLL